MSEPRTQEWPQKRPFNPPLVEFDTGKHVTGWRRILCKLSLCRHERGYDAYSTWEKCSHCGAIREFRRLDDDESRTMATKENVAEFMQPALDWNKRQGWKRDEDDDFYMQVGP